MAALVAAALRDAGERPAILSRGYARARAEDGVVVVRDAGGIRADLDRAGDEPLMLARQLEGVAVLVSPSRHLAGRLAECRLGCTVHVLDDGFQHFELRRDADLVIVTREDLERPVTLPSGRLREPLDVATAADAVVVLDAGREDAGSEDPAYGADAGRVSGSDVGRVFRPGIFRPGVPVWHARRTQAGATTTDPVLAVAGIASPASFFASLRSNGWRVVAELPFRDHYRYAAADVARIAERARSAGARRVVTTDKDLVRLLPFRPFPLPIEAVPLTLALDDRAALTTWLLSVVGEARTRRANGAGETGGVTPLGQ